MLKIIPKVIKYINDDPKHDKVYEQSSKSSIYISPYYSCLESQVALIEFDSDWEVTTMILSCQGFQFFPYYSC